MNKKIISIISLSLIFSFGALVQAYGKVLFEDDFESDKIGKEPSKWEVCAGKGKGTVVEEPEDKRNQVLSVAEHFRWGGSHVLVGELDWTNYVAEWDWMFAKDTHHAMVYFWKDSEHFYHFSRREGNIVWQNYARENGWVALESADYPTFLNEWYRIQLTVKDDGSYSAKIKEKVKKTSFEKIEPFLSGKDDRYKSGKFGTNGAVTSYIDNVIIYEIGTPESEIKAVSPASSLSVSWGYVKTMVD